MKKLLVIAFALAASPCLADPVLVQIEPEPAWPLLARLDRPHSDDASAAIERAAPSEDRHVRRHHHRRHR